MSHNRVRIVTQIEPERLEALETFVAAVVASHELYEAGLSARQHGDVLAHQHAHRIRQIVASLPSENGDKA